MDKLKKPQSAYNYYIKSWKTLTVEQKEPFVKLASDDKDRYLAETKVFADAEENETRKKEVFISRSYDRAPCVGMDNGFESFEIIGPAEKLTEYTKKDHEKFKKDFDEIKENGEKIPLYKSISVGGLEYTHNIKVAKKWQCNVYTMGKSIQSGDNWWGITNKKKQEHFTEYYNYNMVGNKKWRTVHKNTWRATKLQ